MRYYDVIGDARVADIARQVGCSPNNVRAWLMSDWPDANMHDEWLQHASDNEIAMWVSGCIVRAQIAEKEYNDSRL